MGLLIKDLGNMVIAAACGVVIGGAFGVSIENYRIEKYNNWEREENRAVASGKYELNRRTVAGGAAVGGALCVLGYLFRGNKRKEEELEGRKEDD